MYQTHNIPVTRTARFVTIGDKSADIKEVWFVLHGYGQLAEDFIKQFEVLRSEHRFIVAPEALSRFYTRRSPERIGASWMTREARDHEISDYVAYLNQVALYVYDALSRRTQTVVLGFSQGATTASRWVTLGRLPAKRLIMWGGDIANDLDLKAYAPVLNNLHPIFVVGNSDNYITPARLQSEQERLEHHQISYELISFEGGHEINQEVLSSLTPLQVPHQNPSR